MILINKKISIVGSRRKVYAAEEIQCRNLTSETHEYCPTVDPKPSLHPLFEEILRPQIEATGERPFYHPPIIHSNGVIEQGGKFYVPKRLAHLYDGPAYRGRVIIVEDEK